MTPLAIPRESLTVELDVLCAVARYDSWQKRLPEIAVAAYEPDVRFLSRALLLLAEAHELRTVYEVRIGDVPCDIADAMGAADAGVVLTAPGLWDALKELGAPSCDRLVRLFEDALAAAPCPARASIDRIVELARAREIMYCAAEVYNGIAEHADDVWLPALDRLRGLADAVLAA